MLYLAEVHKKTGFMGGKTELKLLARQQSEQNWSTLSGEEMVPVEIANEYNAGVLVLVDLDNNQQVKKVQDANRHLVGILKTFSRMREKFRSQEEEIEGWKQSLIYQSQELTRREVDIEARSEELQQLEAESHKIEDQRQEFEESRSQILQLKEDIERDRAQLEEAWGLLHNAQQQHDQTQKATALSDDQVHHLEGLIGRLEGTLNHQGGVQSSLQTLRDRGNEQQSILQQFWNQFDQERGQADNTYSELEQQSRILDQSWQTWHQDQAALYQLQSQLTLQQETLAFKQNHQKWLQQQVQVQGDFEKDLQCIRDGISGDLQVDLVSLKEMPLNDLEETVDRLQKELGKLSHFVSDQEEELNLQSQTIEELQAKINQASEYDRLNLASDLEDEQQNYRFLEETLQGQRQTLKDRNSILKLHQNILNQRKGIAGKDDDLGQQVTPLIEKASQHRQSLQSVLQTLEQEISTLQTTIQQTQAQVELSTDTLAQTRINLDNQAKQLNQRLMEVGQLNGRVNGLQQTLQPLQDGLNGFHQALDSVWTPFETSTSEQQQVVNELKHTVISLSQIPEAAG